MVGWSRAGITSFPKDIESLMEEQDIERLMEAEAASTSEDNHMYFFVHRKHFLAIPRGPMPVFQELSKAGKLRAHMININMAASSRYRRRFVIASHRWRKKHHPDADGAQLRAMQEEALKCDLRIWFWIDWMCMPQEIRDEDDNLIQAKTELEKRYFGRALTSVNVLYLFMDVFIVFDLDYMRRFWCLLESYLATHRPTPDGLEFSDEESNLLKLET